MIVAAEREIVRGVEHAPRQFRLERDLAGGEHIGGYRHDCRAAAQSVIADADVDAVTVPADHRHRPIEPR